jgi:6-methylsalicylate decarboxylase
MDVLDFDGVCLFTNVNGTYLGDPKLDPILQELDRRSATVFVHPAAPTPETKLDGVSTPVQEFTFDTTRAVTNMIFTGARKRFPNMNMIFSHGGGTVPFLADRLAIQATFPWQGNRKYDECMAELRSFYYDTAGATSAPQLAALHEFIGPSKLLYGTDCRPYPFMLSRRTYSYF